METRFSPEQMARPEIQVANDIFRKCVHCGFCTATCPTYVLTGDELDGPRGRIYQIKDMLEADRPAGATLVKHIDRCLSCLSCMTTCPSGVHYMHLVDLARARIQATFRRPWPDRMLRALLALVLPNPRLLRLSLSGARLAKPLARLLPGRLSGLLAMAPDRIANPSPMDAPQVFPAEGKRRKRVALMTGCAQRVLRPSINESTVRLLRRLGCEVVVANGAGCCGALVHHMGREAEALAAAKANIAAWQAAGVEAVVINASGCGTQVKDYGFMLREDAAWGPRAAAVSAMTRDVTELVTELGLGGVMPGERPSVAYHSACSMQHGQGLTTGPQVLLEQAGFAVRRPAESHLCCGSAGTYNILQPAFAGRLKARKAGHLAATGAAVIATGNIGCLEQLAGALDAPVVHTVELLDWATGGPKPEGLQ